MLEVVAHEANSRQLHPAPRPVLELSTDASIYLSADDWRPVMETLLLKPEEVAEYLNIGRSKVYELMRAGRLESVRIGSCRRIPRPAADAYVESLRGALLTS